MTATTRIWWCFFCNNQFRILQQSQVQTPEELADTFGKNLASVGKMWMLWDKIKEPLYLSRIWCIFEVHEAVMHYIPSEILLPPSSSTILLDKNAANTSVTDLLQACKVNAEDAKATMLADEVAIKQLIREQSTFSKVNALVERQLGTVMLDLLRQSEGGKHTCEDGGGEGPGGPGLRPQEGGDGRGLLQAGPRSD